MALEVKRKERETTQGLIRRFSRRLKKSGILIRARKRRYRKKGKSKQSRLKAALRREDKKKEYERMKKLGQKFR